MRKKKEKKQTRKLNEHYMKLSEPFQISPEAHPASCTMGISSLTGSKAGRRSSDNPPPSSVEVEYV
jgi:hypothetical protein